MNDPRRPHRRSALEILRDSVHDLPRVHLRESQDGQESPVVRPHSPASPERPGWPERIGHHQVSGEIARGGVGAILKGRDLDLGREVALKVLLDSHRENPDLIRRFVEEAQIGSQLQHPGIVPVHTMGILEGRIPYFSMKLVKGRTLAALLEDRRDPEEGRQRFLGIFEQICQTLAYSHARSVVHRDLKPSNVMVGAFGEVLVLDWGLAKVLPREREASGPKKGTTSTPPPSVIETIRSAAGSSHSLAGSVLGTPAYMSPEQARGDLQDVDARSDVFGLGAILCEILTGNPPYTGESAETIYRKARKGYLDEASARLEDSSAPPELLDLARRCLAFEPRERPQDAGVVAQAIQAHLNSLEERTRKLGVEAGEARALGEEERRGRRLFLILGGACLALLLAAGGSYLAVERSRSGQRLEAMRLQQEGLQSAQQLLGEARASGERDLPRWEKALAAAREAVDRARSLSDPAVQSEAAGILAEAERQAASARAAAERAARNRGMVERLEGVQAQAWERDFGEDSHETLLYRRAFLEYGIDAEGLATDDAARAVRESGIAPELTAAITDWARWKERQFGEGSLGWRKLVEIANAADSDPWRVRLRKSWKLKEWSDLSELAKLASEARGKDLPHFALELLANSLSAGGESERARMFLIAARIRAPEHPGIHHLLGTLSARTENQLAFLNTALALRPESGNSIFEYAWALIRTRETRGYEESRDWFEKALSGSPHDPNLLAGLAAAVFGLDRQDQAEGYQREAIRLQPQEGWMHFNLGIFLRNRGDREGALREFRKAYELQSAYRFARFYGYELRDAGDWDGALAVWSDILRSTENSFIDQAVLHTDTAIILLTRRDLAGASFHLREAIQLRPESTRETILLGAVLVEMGKPAEALAAFQKACEIDPANGSDVLAIRSFLERLHLPAERDAALERSLESFIASLEGIIESRASYHPDLRTWYLLAQGARLEALPSEEALAEAEKIAGEQGKEYPEALDLLARARWRSGDHRGAIRILEEAARRPGFPPLLARRLEEYHFASRPDLPTFAAIDRPLSGTALLVRERDLWRYFPGKKDPSPGLEWTEANFDDSAWAEGPSGFGYGDDDDATVLADMAGRYTTVFIRKKLVLPETLNGRFELRVRSDDGFIAYVNGQEAGRFRAGTPGERLGSANTASENHEAIDIDVIDLTKFLTPGENILALQGFNENLSSSDFSLIPEVYGLVATSLEEERKLLDGFRKTAQGADAPARIAYFEGRLLQLAAKPGEALVPLFKALAAAPGEIDPSQRIVECLEMIGKELRPGTAGSSAVARDPDEDLAALAKLAPPPDLPLWLAESSKGASKGASKGVSKEASKGTAAGRRGPAAILRSFLARLGEALSSAAAGRPGSSIEPVYLGTLSRLLDVLEAKSALELAAGEAARAGRSLSETHLLLARARARAGDRRGAVAALEEALDLEDPPRVAEEELAALRASLLPDLPTMGSIDWALEGEEVLVREKDPWRYFPGVEEPALTSLAWAKAAFVDAAWTEGSGPFGYGGEGKPGTDLVSMKGSASTLYLRRTLSIAALEPGRKIVLRVRTGGGFVAYVNGKEAGRMRGGEGEIPLDATAQATAGHSTGEKDEIDLTKLLKKGVNSIALQALSESSDASEFLLAAEIVAQRRPSAERDRARLAPSREAMTGPDGPARRAYLEGRLLQIAGQAKEALASFEKALKAQPLEPRIETRRAECLKALGRIKEIPALLAPALKKGMRVNRPLLALWLEAQQGAKKSLGEILAAWPRKAVPFPIPLVPASVETMAKGETWRFSVEPPRGIWREADYDDSLWEEAPAPFGNVSGGSRRIRSPWKEKDLWLRKTFPAELPAATPKGLRVTLRLRVLHDDGAEINLNGKEIARLTGWSDLRYVTVPLDQVKLAEGGLLRSGQNALAVHCVNEQREQAIDVGLEVLVETAE